MYGSDIEQENKRRKSSPKEYPWGNFLELKKEKLEVVTHTVIPLPVADLGQVNAVLGNILLVLHQLVLELLDQGSAPVAQLFRQQLDDIHG